ncbi:hypothetical protein [Terrihabitans sp. B22-R8]|uniref:hypothetical protein n=1 Tax=Terrihabitans sp. B22-R8 TaxID=3425128 RepID=UPI00403CEE07
MTILSRIILIPVGYLAAIFAAIALIAGVEWVRAYPPVAGDPGLVTMTALAVFTDAVVMSGIIGYTALGPVLVAVGLAEIFALRSFFYFAAVGLAIAGALSRILGPADYPALPAEPALIAAAGIAGGLGYWVSSGRWSGIKRPREPIAS